MPSIFQLALVTSPFVDQVPILISLKWVLKSRSNHCFYVSLFRLFLWRQKSWLTKWYETLNNCQRSSRAQEVSSQLCHSLIWTAQYINYANERLFFSCCVTRPIKLIDGSQTAKPVRLFLISRSCYKRLWVNLRSTELHVVIDNIPDLIPKRRLKYDEWLSIFHGRIFSASIIVCSSVSDGSDADEKLLSRFLPPLAPKCLSLPKKIVFPCAAWQNSQAISRIYHLGLINLGEVFSRMFGFHSISFNDM